MASGQVIFCSNGYEHWIWDDALYPPRAVQGFYELALMIQRRSSRKPLATAAIDASIIERYYQVRTVRRIGEAFEKQHLRKALAVMATGAGKTRTVIALADVLMRLPDSSPVNLVTDKHTEGRVFVSTYPTMMGLIDDATDGKNSGQKRFGVGHFDLIVINEAHRSVYQKYRAIFEYFDRHQAATKTPPVTSPKRSVTMPKRPVTMDRNTQKASPPADTVRLGQFCLKRRAPPPPNAWSRHPWHWCFPVARQNPTAGPRA